jgi:hypothetical protein
MGANPVSGQSCAAVAATRPCLLWGARRIASAFQARRAADLPEVTRRIGLGHWLTTARTPSDEGAASTLFDEIDARSSVIPPSVPLHAGEDGDQTDRGLASADPTLDIFAERLDRSAEAFSRRLEHASLNLLQCVEGMRSAATELGKSAGRAEEYHTRMEAMFHHVEQMASQIAAIEARQQERLETIAGALHGITVSLTTVVSAANESQASVADVARSLAESVGCLDRSLARMGTAGESCADRSPSIPAPPVETVTLRHVMEVQRQFINTLDDRLACLASCRDLIQKGLNKGEPTVTQTPSTGWRGWLKELLK